MGLDMYLRKEYYVKNWEHNPKDQWHTFTILKGGKPSPIPVEKIAYVTTEEVYWRKANAIHKWFVDNVQDSKDDCGTYDVDTESLKVLLDLIKSVLADHSLAKTRLPTQEGFFFGDTGYDQYYYDDLEYTRKELERVLAQGEDGGYFQYHSSW